MEIIIGWFKSIPAKLKSISGHLKNGLASMGRFIVKRKILVGSLALAVVLVAGGAIFITGYIHRISSDPGSFFNQTAAPALTDEPSDTDDPSTDEPDDTDVPPTPTPTLSPYDQLNSQADQTMANNQYVNVLLIGVDWAEERVDNKKEYVNKDFNSDVMLDLVVDFQNKTVDMISVPRDSYAKIVTAAKGPLTGIYKLNFSLTAGGGIGAKDDAGFMSVCKSVQYLFDDKGRIPINNYIAVTMPAVKDLVDSIGGIDYDMDVEFTLDGRHYKKGMQHLDGQGVLDYCRIRKGDLSSGFGDLNRVNRQKEILMVIFKKLQTSSSILDVPKILTSMSGSVFTNLSWEQLAALAVFGSKLPSDNISMNTIPGSYYYGIFNKNYVLIDQTKRAAMLNKIFNKYGITVGKQNKYSPGTAQLLWAFMQGTQYVKVIDNVLAKEAKLPDDQKKLIDPVLNAQLATDEAATKSMLSKYKKQANGSGNTSKDSYTALQNQVKALYNLANSMFSKAGYKVSWTVSIYKSGQIKMKE